MISQGVLGNLRVYLIQPPKMCAGLQKTSPFLPRRRWPSFRAAATGLRVVCRDELLWGRLSLVAREKTFFASSDYEREGNSITR